MFVYLDNSATTKPYLEVVEVMKHYLEEDFGNASSLHKMGITAEKAVKGARKIVAASLKVKDNEIYFTSGGTESDNTALFGAANALKRRGKKIITSKIEHPAVLSACKRLKALGYEVVYINVDEKGLLNIEELKDQLDPNTVLISIMHANNELGTIQPLKEIGELKRRQGIAYFHTDAVQSYGKIRLGLEEIGVDMLSLSGHKIHGPKGIGALYLRSGCHIEPYIYGGGQEREFRSGTENVPAIAGLGKCAAMISERIENNAKKISDSRNYLLNGIKTEIKDIKINSYEDERCLPNILNISFLGIRGEVLLHMLEQNDIFVSTGSACYSKKKGQSHVLKAAGLTDKEIEGAIRFSFSEFNNIEEMDHVLYHLKNSVENIRKMTRKW